MLDTNGQYTQLTFNDALEKVLSNASAVGVSVPSGSVEEQLAGWLAQTILDMDNAIYSAVVQQYSPQGSNIDIQNPGFPRLQPDKAKGFLKIVNNTASSISYPLNTVFTSPNGNKYENPTDIITVLSGQTGYLSIQSQIAGETVNLPSGQTFTAPPGGTITNPQPLTGGRSLETDSNYSNRLNYYRSNNTSQQASTSAKNELLEFYQVCEIYVNNTNSDLVTPIPIPPRGLNIITLFDSGINAGVQEIQNAIDISTRRFEFANLNTVSNDLHPVLKGQSYVGLFPQVYSFTVAQSVNSYITAEIMVSFPPSTLDAEKAVLAQTFATSFVQRLIDSYSGSGGSFNLTFTPVVGSPVISTPSITAATIPPVIGPYVAVEAIRSLISEAEGLQGLYLSSLQKLTVEFDPNEYEQTPVTLSISAPLEGTISKVNFVTDSLFSDGSSWYDRFIFLDPSKININVIEI